MKVAISMPAEARPNTSFEKHLRCYEHLQSKHDIEVDVFTPHPDELSTDNLTPVPCPQTRFESMQYTLHGKRKRLFNNDINYMPEFSQVYDLILDREYDVVQTTDPTLYPASYSAYKASREVGARLVPIASAIKTQESLMSRDEVEEIVDYASALPLMSPRTHDRFVREGLVSEEDERVLYTGLPINTEIFSPGGQENNSPKLLSIGVLEERKGFKEICTAVSELASEGYDFEWHIAGAGELESWIEEYVETNELSDRVQMYGLVPHKEIPDMYEKSDIFVLHSKETTLWAEEFGAVFGEAMSSELPVVGSTSGAIPWVVRNEEDGILVEEGDVEGVTTALASLLKNSEKRKRMGKKGRENVEERFELDVVANTFSEAWGWSNGSGEGG